MPSTRVIRPALMARARFIVLREAGEAPERQQEQPLKSCKYAADSAGYRRRSPHDWSTDFIMTAWAKPSWNSSASSAEIRLTR